MEGDALQNEQITEFRTKFAVTSPELILKTCGQINEVHSRDFEGRSKPNQNRISPSEIQYDLM